MNRNNIKYLPRIIDYEIQMQLQASGAIQIKGPKWCGKSTTGEFFSNSAIYMQDNKMNYQYMSLAELNPSKLLEGETPRLIDEWQLAPKLWDSVRDEVDKRQKQGQFILTGSVTPINSNEIHHSGIGRITVLKMRTMSLYESQDSNGSVSLENLFANKDVDGTNSLKLDDIAKVIVRGGWPLSINSNEKTSMLQARNYYDSLINSELIKEDSSNYSKRNALKMKALLRAYAKNIGTQTSINKIITETNSESDIERTTVYNYLKDLTNLFVIEEMQSWNTNLRSKTAIMSSDTHYFMDPSIGCAALGIGYQDLMNDLKTMGFLFENLVIRDLRIYAQSLDGEVYHFRNRNGLECDSVIHLRNGNYGLIEIKLGGEKLINEGCANLLKLEKDIDTSRMNKPSFMAIITAVGDYAYKNKDGIYIIPIGCLKN